LHATPVSRRVGGVPARIVAVYLENWKKWGQANLLTACQKRNG